MSEGNIPIDYNFWKHQRNQASKKVNYDKMLVITFLSYRSTRFFNAVAMFDRKVLSSQI